MDLALTLATRRTPTVAKHVMRKLKATATQRNVASAILMVNEVILVWYSLFLIRDFYLTERLC